MLTREEALRKHREMWEAMREALGDNPGIKARAKFKIEWCLRHEKYPVRCHCYLCQYTHERGLGCGDCPIDWGNGDTCVGRYTDYGFSSLSEILALPERKVEENGVVAETES